MGSSRTVSAAVIAAALFAIAGCGSVSESRLDFTDTEEVKITEIVVESGAGSVVVRTGDRSNVDIARVVRYRGGEPDRTYRIDGTTLRVETACGQWCNTSYEIDAPKGVVVRGENGSGDVTLTDVAEVDIEVGSGSVEVTGATGPVKVETGSGNIEVTRAAGQVTVKAGSGDITITDPAGVVNARVSSGSITGTGLGAGQVTANSSSGNIKLTLTRQVGVKAHAQSGSVTVTAPAGSYRVTADASSGKTQIDVVNDPAAEHVFDFKTGSGDITVKPG